MIFCIVSYRNFAGGLRTWLERGLTILRYIRELAIRGYLLQKPEFVNIHTVTKIQSWNNVKAEEDEERDWTSRSVVSNSRAHCHGRIGNEMFITYNHHSAKRRVFSYSNLAKAGLSTIASHRWTDLNIFIFNRTLNSLPRIYITIWKFMFHVWYGEENKSQIPQY